MAAFWERYSPGLQGAGPPGPSGRLPVATVTLTYPNGYVERMTYGEWERCRGQIHERYGPPDRIRYAPEDEGELTRRIMLEHRFQKGWNRKPRTRRTDAPCR